MAEGLTRADRRAAIPSLDQIAAEVSLIATWLDAFGGDADKASVLLECAARDLAAATWIIKPADHERPPGWLADSRAMRRN